MISIFSGSVTKFSDPLPRSKVDIFGYEARDYLGSSVLRLPFVCRLFSTVNVFSPEENLVSVFSFEFWTVLSVKDPLYNLPWVWVSNGLPLPNFSVAFFVDAGKTFLIFLEGDKLFVELFPNKTPLGESRPPILLTSFIFFISKPFVRVL